MRVRRPDAPWRMEDDGQEETDQDAGEGPQSEAESPWNGVDIGIEPDFTGKPLTPSDLERAGQLIKEQYSHPTNMFVSPQLLKDLTSTILAEKVLSNATQEMRKFAATPTVDLFKGKPIRVADFKALMQDVDNGLIGESDILPILFPDHRKKED